VGFIPRLTGSVYAWGVVTAFVYEGWFDQWGGTRIDGTRYAELLSTPGWNPEVVCPGRFAIDVDNGEFEKYTRVGDTLGPFIQVDSSPACAHSELKTGKWLHHECSSCTGGPVHCTDPSSPRGWDQACVDAVRNNTWCMADVATRLMAKHSECTVGEKLDLYDTGCTLRVCSQDSSCCSSGWSQSCVNLADAVCTGGGEHRPAWGFCSNPIIFEPPVPPVFEFGP
jgi:hypothetical protein